MTGLLEQAAESALPSLDGLPSGRLTAPTPCARWDLAALLAHLLESVAALHEAAELGCVGLPPNTVQPPGPAEVAAAIRGLVDCWRPPRPDNVLVGGRTLGAGVVEIVGAVELAVHGWDVFAARGRPRPIPAALALELTGALPLVAGGLVRPGLFALPVPAPGGCPGDRLVALLGRHPYRDEFSFRTES